MPKGYNTHGLRKAGATRGADAGWTDHEIMAWGGWKSLSEVPEVHPRREPQEAGTRRSPQAHNRNDRWQTQMRFANSRGISS